MSIGLQRSPMKAAQRKAYGNQVVIEINEVPIPDIKSNEILIKVIATTVNRTDCGVLTGLPLVFRLFTGIGKPKNLTLGTDYAGTIERIGDSVSGFELGDRVFGFHDEGNQSQAQYVKVKANSDIAKIPDEIDFDTAVASIEGAHYAINFINKFNLNPSDHVLVNGASGAIGSAAVQLLKNQGAEITTIAHSRLEEIITSLGADHFIAYDNDPFKPQHETFNHIFDTVGNLPFSYVKPALKKKGTYISSELGPNAENIYLSLAHIFFGEKKVRFPIPLNRQHSLDQMASMLKAKTFTPLIDSTYPLNEIGEAYNYVLKGHKTGNVLVHYW